MVYNRAARGRRAAFSDGSMASGKHQQGFLDTATLLTCGLVGVAAVLVTAASIVTGPARQQYSMDDEAYQDEVLARISPIGRVALPGAELEPTESVAAEVVAVVPVATQLSGPQVYNAACVPCHGPGVAGAPKLGSPTDWAPRIAQGLDLVRQHALQGYQGDTGYMPPKGGRIDLSDEEIVGAINYMLEESR